jgi:hypothetical protein
MLMVAKRQFILSLNNPEEMPVPKLETIGQKCRFFEMELLQSFVRHIKALVLDQQGTEEVLKILMAKRLNRLAH